MSIDREVLLAALTDGLGFDARERAVIDSAVRRADEPAVAAALGASEGEEPDTSDRDAAGYVAIVEAAATCIGAKHASGNVTASAESFLSGEFTRWSRWSS